MGCLQGSRRYGTEESAPIDWIVPPREGMVTQPSLSEMFAYHATTMANTIRTSLVVFSRQVSLRSALAGTVHDVWGCSSLHSLALH